MSAYTMNSFGITRAFRKSKQSRPRDTVQGLVIDAKASKVQHILGLSIKELDTSRSQSLSSSSTTKPPASSLSGTTSASVSNTQLSDIKLSPDSIKRLDSKTGSAIAQNELDNASTKSPPAGPQLSSFPSTSTLRSHYDPSKAPLSISQQTSNSSSRDFALRKGTPSVISRKSQEMEHAVQMLFLRSTKPKPKESKKVSRINTQYLDSEANLRGSGTEVSHNLGNHTYFGASRSSISLPATPPPTTPGKKLFSNLRRAESQQIRSSPATNTVTRDPYAKVNVRRPKVGAKYWFDDVGDDLSEEENNDEPTASPHFVNQVEQVFAATESAAASVQNSISAISTASTVPSAADVAQVHKPSPLHRVRVPPGSARALLSEHKPLPRNVSFHEGGLKDQQTNRSRKLRKRPSTLATADLSKQSILCLSSSDDEDDAEIPEYSEASSAMKKIRESLSEEQIVDSDVEIGVARTIKANSGEPLVRAPHPRTEALRRSRTIPSPIHVPARASSRHASYILDPSSEQDTTEEDIITSFPATPSDSASFRTSIRSSMFSETGSLASTRPMLVTKQEEKLLAAMRMKKAALRQPDRDTDRDGALRVLESGSQHSATSNRRDHDRGHRSEQDRLDQRLSSRYVPNHSHRRSVSGNDAGSLSARARESGTTFETSIYSQRNSQATVRTMFSDESDSPYSAYPQSDATVMSPTRPHPPHLTLQGRSTHHRDTYYSSPSSDFSNRRDSHVVMLDGLDEALSRDHVPSQLFMEAPFIGWEKAGLATTAH